MNLMLVPVRVTSVYFVLETSLSWHFLLDRCFKENGYFRRGRYAGVGRYFRELLQRSKNKPYFRGRGGSRYFRNSIVFDIAY